MSSRYIPFNILPLSLMSVKPIHEDDLIRVVKQLLSINEKTEGCLHDLLSLKGDTSVHDMRVLCHACLEKI